MSDDAVGASAPEIGPDEILARLDEVVTSLDMRGERSLHGDAATRIRELKVERDALRAKLERAREAMRDPEILCLACLNRAAAALKEEE